MGHILHGSARTTAALRRAIQQRQASRAKRSERDHRHPQTVAKWKKRTQVHDAPMGPKQPRATLGTLEEEALMVAFCKHTLLPLDDCLDALQATIPPLTRSALHLGLPRHGINRLPERTSDTPQQKQFTSYPIGSCHIAMAEVRTEDGTRHVCVAIERASTCASAEWHTDANKTTATQFLHRLIAAVPSNIHTVLTANGIQVTNRTRDQYAFLHICDRVCQEYGIDHRLTTTNPPRTNGQVERMNRTLKDATGRKYHDQTHQYLKEHRPTFLMAAHFAKRLNTLKGLTPYESIGQCWHKEPERFTLHPYPHTRGLNT